eukprot:m.318298 g.318298  ORF g.318298 m.318298 type:complete len:385 (+) comp27572_c0_seq8:291-1445(+)
MTSQTSRAQKKIKKFTDLTSLVQLFLQDNHITLIHVGAFGDLRSLTALYLQNNLITDFGALQTNGLGAVTSLGSTTLVQSQRVPFNGCLVDLGACPAVSDRCSSVATCASAYGVQSTCCNSSLGACRACGTSNAPLVSICVRCDACSIAVTQSSPLVTSCVSTSNGTCVTDGPGNYLGNENCSFRMITNATLSVTQWRTNSGYDYMTIGSIRYFGANSPDGVMLAAGSSFTWTTNTFGHSGGFTICASNTGTDCSVVTLPLPSTRSSITFNYTLTIDPDAGSFPARGLTDVGSPVNRDLTIGKAYAFRPPNGSSTETGLATYLDSAYGAIAYSLNVTSLDPAAGDEILINTVTGYILVVPSRPYTASVELLATDAGGFATALRQ